MQIYFYRSCNFRPEAVERQKHNNIVEFFDKNHINPDEYIIGDKDGKEYSYSYDLADGAYVVYPKIAKGSKSKGWLGVVLGIVTFGAAGLVGGFLGITAGAAKMLGIGMALSGAGTLILGNQKMPSLDYTTDSATQTNYQWNVGSLSTSRGVKGITFGSNVVPEGELLAYRTFGENGKTTINTREQWQAYYAGGWQDVESKGYAEYIYRRYSHVKGIRSITSIDSAIASSNNTSWLEMLIGCGEGALDSITNIKVNGTAIGDIEGATYLTRTGTNNQSSLPDTDLDTQIDLMSISQTMPMKLDGSDTPLVLTTSEECTTAIITCQTNAVYCMDQSSGAKNCAYLKPVVKYRLSGSSGAWTSVSTGHSEIDNDYPFKAESAYYFDVTIKFPSSGIYEISLQNCSAEKCVEKGLLSSLPSVLPDRFQCAISIDNIALYGDVEQTYPGTALIFLRLPASQALNGSVPEVTWNQSRANGYVWNGSSYVTKPLSNLAWALYDILAQVKYDEYTGAYHNEGEAVANLDYDRFSEFATFCSGLGITGNWFLNKLDTSWSTAMSLATSARAFIGTRNGKICPYWDCATDMTQIFTVGNYEEMSGSINAKKDRARAIEATFNDENDSYKSKTIRVEVDDFAADADAVGVTYLGLSTAAAVHKAAHYQLRKNKYLTQTVKFTANLDALVCELNDVIGVQCDITKFGVGGRIYSVSGNSVTLDAPVTLSGGSYALLVAHENGNVERMAITETTGTLTTVTVSSYTTAPKAEEVYSIGVINNEVKKYRVTNIVKTSELKCEIEAVEYIPQVYVEGTAPDISYTNPSASISNITVTQNPESVSLAWNKDINTAYVDVYVDGAYYGRYAEGAVIPNVNSTQQVECIPVNAYGEEGTAVVRAISNSLPTPSTPSNPIVQAYATSCIAYFGDIPTSEYITWLVIKEGETELGRIAVAGNEATVDIPLSMAEHHLTAYYLNSYNKTSLGRDFTATPKGIDNALLNPGALAKPQGSILRLSAKGCDNDSIKLEGGVKDVSGYDHHGTAYGGVTVLDGGEGFSFDGSNPSYIGLPEAVRNSLNNLDGATFALRFKGTSTKATQYLMHMCFPDGKLYAELTIVDGKGRFGGRHLATDAFKACDTAFDVNDGEEHQIVGTMDYANGKMYMYFDGVYQTENALTTSGKSTAPADARVAYNAFVGEIKDFRIYPRALTATEVKSLFMLPDEAVFGQITADKIGANAVKAVHLDAGSVTANALAANCVTAAKIASEAITTDKLAANAITSAKIASEAITSDKIAAGSITANQLSVESLKAPSGCQLAISAKGITPGQLANGAVIPDDSSFGNEIKVVGDGLRCAKEEHFPHKVSSCFYSKDSSSTAPYLKGPAFNIGLGSFTIAIWVLCYDNADGLWRCICGSKSASAAGSQGFGIYFHNGRIQWSTADGSSGQEIQTKNTYDISGTFHHIAMTRDANNISNSGIYVDGVKVELNSLPSEIFDVGNLPVCFGHGGPNNTLVAYSAYTNGRFYKRVLSDAEVKTLYMLGTDTESGQITADRIATDAIRSRNCSGGGDGSFTSVGSRLDLSTGWLSFPKTCISSVGKIKSTDVDLSGKITATSGSFGANSLNESISSFPWPTGTWIDGSYTGTPVTSLALQHQILSSNYSIGQTITIPYNVVGMGLYIVNNGIDDDSTSSYTMQHSHGIFIKNQTAEPYGSGITIENSQYDSSDNGCCGLEIVNKSGSPCGIYVRNGSGCGEETRGIEVFSTGNQEYGICNYYGTAYSTSGWSGGSDRSIKKNLREVSTLNKLKFLEVKKYKYSRKAICEKQWASKNPDRPIEEMPKFTDEGNEPDYISAMAQEFNSAFGVDNNSDGINYTNAIGVALKAIQELSAQLDDTKRELRALKRIMNITNEQIAIDRDNHANAMLEKAKARQARIEKRKAELAEQEAVIAEQEQADTDTEEATSGQLEGNSEVTNAENSDSDA